MNPADIELARSIKPSRAHRPDGYVWSLTKFGLYTVKYGYELATQLQLSLRPQQILQPSVDALKRQIWAQKTIKKLKHFMWNAVAGCTPVCSRLADWHCEIARSCPRCDPNEERQIICSSNVPQQNKYGCCQTSRQIRDLSRVMLFSQISTTCYGEQKRGLRKKP